MGAHAKTFIGIYLEIKSVKSIVEQKLHVHPVTGKMMKTKFCPITGVEGIVKVQNLERYVKPPFANTDKFRDMFFTPAYVGSSDTSITINIFNGNRRFNYTLEECEDYSLDKINPQEVIKNFIIEYRDVLEKFDSDYYKVCYGVINYAH